MRLQFHLSERLWASWFQVYVPSLVLPTLDCRGWQRNQTVGKRLRNTVSEHQHIKRKDLSSLPHVTVILVANFYMSGNVAFVSLSMKADLPA